MNKFVENQHYFIAESGCWEWLMALNNDGYGACSEYTYGNQRAHRAMLLMVGEDIEGKVVHHKCNNRKCINIGHLHVGTQKHNMEECVKSGRFKSNSGEDDPRAVLDWESVLDIRYVYSLGNISYSQLAKDYGVGKSTISNIITNNTWRE